MDVIAAESDGQVMVGFAMVACLALMHDVGDLEWGSSDGV